MIEPKNNKISGPDSQEKFLKPENYSNLEIPDTDYISHFKISLKNHNALKQGLIDCLKYDPFP